MSAPGRGKFTQLLLSSGPSSQLPPSHLQGPDSGRPAALQGSDSNRARALSLLWPQSVGDGPVIPPNATQPPYLGPGLGMGSRRAGGAHLKADRHTHASASPLGEQQ